jgi:Cof subfamily protein (haloacid dehalogenase superfamily)
MNTKIIFFDIDGTILSERTRMISESTIAAIRKAKTNGHLVFVNSGRTFAEIDEATKKIGFDGYVCGCGTYIIYHGKALLRTTLSKKMCRQIVNDLRKYKLEAVLEGTETIYFDAYTAFSSLIKQRESFINDCHFSVKDWDADDIAFDKFCIWYDDPDQVKSFIADYSDIFDFIDREGSFVEIVPKGYSKATGIEYLLSYLNIPHENTYALGDGANDLSMLTYVKHSIGMGNADSGVTEIVAFLTKDVDDDGVDYALRHYNII